ncbi:hypothetical protein HMPREF9087_3276 [Enterococcus casseliflavus ATCC 12755]|uniref:Uncharacterized protein n=1 Tax=Enterococcus casseliflavus ATCC 12755 TaxID=888066 RepID=F0EPD4_ENTCA|nr:hypothetical protein HMPREF9087_3276 [Enterococcus casseliflavus ATCC 12755]
MMMFAFSIIRNLLFFLNNNLIFLDQKNSEVYPNYGKSMTG